MKKKNHSGEIITMENWVWMLTKNHGILVKKIVYIFDVSFFKKSFQVHFYVVAGHHHLFEITGENNHVWKKNFVKNFMKFFCEIQEYINQFHENNHKWKNSLLL